MSDHAADPSHPRYTSLLQRKKLERALELGMLAHSAHIAHGRGEAFDYLLGEQTHEFATSALAHACAALQSAKHPVFSVNGNTVALAGKEILECAKLISCPVEVNIFYRTEKRMDALLTELKQINEEHNYNVEILGQQPNATIPGLKGPRAQCEQDGIFSSDVVFVPLEDGDRCGALRDMGKTVIVVDLNPLSRSAQNASITIVNEVSRTMREMVDILSHPDPIRSDIEFDNKTQLHRAIATIRKGFV